MGTGSKLGPAFAVTLFPLTTPYSVSTKTSPAAKAQKELPLRSYPYPRYNKPQLVLYEGYVYVGREIDGCGEIFWWQHSFLGLFTQNRPKTCDFRDLSTKSTS